MSFYNMGLPVLSSCRRVLFAPRVYVFSGLQLFKQPITRTTPRILQPCCCCSSKLISPVRNFSISNTNRCRNIQDPLVESPSESNDHLKQSTKSETLKSKKLRSWSFKVASFDSVNIKTSFDVFVRPVSPLEYPAADQAFVNLSLRCNNNEIDDAKFDIVVNSLEAQAEYTGEQLQLQGHIPDKVELKELMSEHGMSLEWHVEVPISFDADIQTFDHGNILVEKLENYNCIIKSEHGNCYINKLKCGNIKVSSLSGDVISKKLLQGNAEIITQDDGTITTDRLQGQTFLLRSEAGSIHCKDIYAIEAVVETTHGGDVELHNVHADCNVTASCDGSVQIDSLEGSLKTSTDAGSINTHLVRHNDARLTSQQGDITVKVPSDIKSRVHLQGRMVSIPAELNAAGALEEQHQSDNSIVYSGEWNRGTKSQLQARTHEGSITVAVQSWFDSLKLTK